MDSYDGWTTWEGVMAGFRKDALEVSSFIGRLLALPRATKRALMIAADLAMVPLALWIALALKTEQFLPESIAVPSFWMLASLSAVATFAWLGLYRSVVRYFGQRAFVAIVAGVSVSALVLALFDRATPMPRLSLSSLGVYWAVATLLVSGSRGVLRHVFGIHAGRNAERVLIYGAGDAGAQLCAALVGGRACLPVGFVDDKRALQGQMIHGVEVFGPEHLPTLIAERRVGGVLLALPSASRRRRREILTLLEPLGTHVRSLPDMAEIIAGRGSTVDVREVDVADLLGRDTVPPDPYLLDGCIRGKSVMVTGAGGSIGSELCRQIVRLSPSRLVLYEKSELGLYQVDMELRSLVDKEGLAVEIISLLGNAHHRDRVYDVMTTYRVRTVYHAAAYKHVPIVEQNVVRGNPQQRRVHMEHG
jgi:FlaA1/EpsC-like NDP-sugar epimerase